MQNNKKLKILYAVQATGNGHITRARVMAKALASLDVDTDINIDVDWIFTGRPKSQLFDMEIFGNYQTFSGLTFATHNGKIQYIKTLFTNNLLRFVRDLFTIDLADYDLLINDFEPLTAWAAKRQHREVVGLSHQMAFNKAIPIADASMLAQFILKYFAPVTLPIGLHWDHFEQDLLPPIVDQPEGDADLQQNKILVYCPFDDLQLLINWLARHNSYQFHVFHGDSVECPHSHIHLHAFSRDNFQAIQKICAGVITSAGFELPSEAIQLGQKLLIKPLKGQMEQASNAKSLALINRATVIDTFSDRRLEQWLMQPQEDPITYPNVALEVARWLVTSEKESLADLSKRLWSATKSNAQYSKPGIDRQLPIESQQEKLTHKIAN